MGTNRLSLYVWYSVTIANITLLAFLVFFTTNIASPVPFSLQDTLRQMNYYAPYTYSYILLSLFVTVTPVLISKTYNASKHYFGYGIPAAVILLLTYIGYARPGCFKTLCGLDSLEVFFIGATIAAAAVIFAIFYTIGIVAQKFSRQ